MLCNSDGRRRRRKSRSVFNNLPLIHFFLLPLLIRSLPNLLLSLHLLHLNSWNSLYFPPPPPPPPPPLFQVHSIRLFLPPLSPFISLQPVTKITFSLLRVKCITMASLLLPTSLLLPPPPRSRRCLLCPLSPTCLHLLPLLLHSLTLWSSTPFAKDLQSTPFPFHLTNTPFLHLILHSLLLFLLLFKLFPRMHSRLSLTVASRHPFLLLPSPPPPPPPSRLLSPPLLPPPSSSGETRNPPFRRSGRAPSPRQFLPLSDRVKKT